MYTNFFATSGLVNCIVAVVSGTVVLFYNWRSRVNRVYFLVGTAVALWAFSYWVWLSSTEPGQALFWAKLMAIGSITLPIVFFHLVVEIFRLEKKFLVIAGYIITSIVAVLSPLDIFITGVSQKLFFPFWPDPGPLYNFVFACLYMPVFLYSFYLMFQNYLRSTGIDKTQALFLLIGSAFGWIGGLTNFFLWYNIPIPPYGNFIFPIYTLFIGYAILKSRVFQTKVIAAEIFTFAIWTFLVLKTTFSPDYREFTVNMLVLVATIIFGFFLIQSVMAEIKYREKITVAYEVEKKARQELMELDSVKNQFIIITQHHLRTPLGSIRGYASALLEGVYGKLPSGFVDPIKRVEISAGRLINVADEFLAISQLQIGKDIVILKPGIEIIPIIEEIIEEQKFEADKRRLSIGFKADASCAGLKITADQQLLKLALFNFVDNAVKYTEEGGIDIMLVKEDKSIKITVKDTGIGMTEKEAQDSLTKLFERGERAKEMYVLGRGIGLYLSNKIIKAHGGGVTAESRGLNLGSSFTIELPLQFS